MNEKILKVENVTHGYNHDRIIGSCPDGTTVEDVKEQFYHPFFGGRDAWVRGTRFGCVVHGCD